jgi:3-phosphoshikimate 1-carboxyvinyltransferase
LDTEILLPSSKSISNRILIIDALSSGTCQLSNLSEAKDTEDLMRCLKSDSTEIHVGEGATTLRFLLAYFAITKKKIKLFCAPSLQKRPVKPLLTILEQLGCKFNYLEKKYLLPLQIIRGVQDDYSKNLFVDSTMSSQFASAILLISPYLKEGLQIQYSESMVSEPYIRMTIQLMREFGIDLIEKDHIVQITPSVYQGKQYSIEADWSAAGFFYALLGLKEKGSLYFPNLRTSGLQGDEILITFFNQFGISTIIERNGIRITKVKINKPEFVEFDFTKHPDLFPPISMYCAITKTNALFKGLQHLVFKESNRLKVISDFLMNQNVKINHHHTGSGDLSADFIMNDFNHEIPTTYCSFNDHRIAMSFSLLNTIRKVVILNPEVVKKSFPGYWDEFNKVIAID